VSLADEARAKLRAALHEYGFTEADAKKVDLSHEHAWDDITRTHDVDLWRLCRECRRVDVATVYERAPDGSPTRFGEWIYREHRFPTKGRPT
jgi:hypothetical protein